MKCYLSTTVLERARIFGQDIGGALFIGLELNEKTTYVYNAIFFHEEEIENITERANDIQLCLPANLSIVGFTLGIGEDRANLERIASRLCSLLKIRTVQCLCVDVENWIVEDRIDFSKSLGTILTYDETRGFSNTQSQKIFWKKYSEITSKTVTVRMRLSVNWNFCSRNSWSGEEMEFEIRRRIEKIVDGKNFFFQLDGVDRVLHAFNNDQGRKVEDVALKKTTIFEAYRRTRAHMEIKCKDLNFTQDVMDCVPLQKITASVLDENGDDRKLHNVVPIVQCEAGDFTSFDIPVNFQILAILSQDSSLASLTQAITESLKRQMELFSKTFSKFSDIKAKKFAILKPKIFLPRQCGHFIVYFFPSAAKDSELESERRNLHKLFDIPADRPTFRKANHYVFPAECGPYLLNVHEHVGESKVRDASVGLVAGNYQYRHYMQDNIDDKNWGCAYRSFQTIWSWFMLQGYVEKPTPTHREIQQALVDVGDRPPNFVGTRQWIGSLELSYCLRLS